MRVTTAFNRVLAVPGASVASVSFTEVGIVIGLRRRFRLLTCPCGQRCAARYDGAVRRWRHLDLGACRVWLEAEIRRVDCRACGRIRTEAVPWARPGARHTRDVEDLVAWLAQRMDKTSVTRLLRMSWEAVDRIVGRVVADRIDDTRLDDLFRIGVDEISYKRGHRYLTVVADHDTGRVVWLAAGRSRDTFEAFFDELGERAGQLEAVSMDASPTYLPVTVERAPQARICLDPFHIIKWANAALELVYRAHPMPRDITGRRWRTIRHALRAGKENLRAEHRAIVNALRRGASRWRSSRPRTGRACDRRVAVVGLVTGVLASGLSLILSRVAGASVSFGHALVALPIALGVAVLAAVPPAISAARARPGAAVHPAVREVRRARRRNTVLGLAMSNLWRVPAAPRSACCRWLWAPPR